MRPVDSRTPVAVVGMAVYFPGANSLESYWHNIVNGVDSITEVPEGRWDEEFYAPGGPRAATGCTAAGADSWTRAPSST